MIGSIISGAMQVGGSIFGAVKASEAARKQNKIIADAERDNQAWYDRRYNEDPTQRADAQRMITRMEESIRHRNKQAAGTAAVMGGSSEALAAEKAANNAAMAETVSSIAAQGDARKDLIEQQYQNRKDGYTQMRANVEAQRAQNIAGAVKGLTAGASKVAGVSFEDLAKPGGEAPGTVNVAQGMKTLTNPAEAGSWADNYIGEPGSDPEIKVKGLS